MPPFRCFWRQPCSFWSVPVFWTGVEAPGDSHPTLITENEDLFLEIAPTMQYGFGRLKTSELPLWNNRQLCGTPFFCRPRAWASATTQSGFSVSGHPPRPGITCLYGAYLDGIFLCPVYAFPGRTVYSCNPGRHRICMLRRHCRRHVPARYRQWTGVDAPVMLDIAHLCVYASVSDIVFRKRPAGAFVAVRIACNGIYRYRFLRRVRCLADYFPCTQGGYGFRIHTQNAIKIQRAFIDGAYNSRSGQHTMAANLFLGTTP